MKSPSIFTTDVGRPAVSNRDAELAAFTCSVVDAARREWGDRLIAEGPFHPRLLYTETHYALTAVLLFLQDGQDRRMLDLAEARLRLWAGGPVPLTFFNAMAICLAAIVFKRSGAEHAGLQSILDELVARTRDHRQVAYSQWCGNNAYLQQVVVDTVLLPRARGHEVTNEGLALLLAEFRSFRTPEGFFFDLPRNGTDHERLCPPTYVMKMLFLLGVCHEVHPAAQFADLFRGGMAAVLPLVTGDGNFSYFGRTDNSPFAAGLTIFNFRKAAQLTPEARGEYQDACARAERFYLTFPRASSGVLESNRFADATSEAEAWYSKDAYAQVAQYSLSSSAYVLLGSHWYPAPTDAGRCAEASERPAAVATSDDLGVVKLTGKNGELVVRTRSEMTSWDRRYLGPTILRYAVDDTLLVGAIPLTVSTDRAAQPRSSANAARRLLDLFKYRYVNGAEQLDGTSVGFLPVLRQGTVDYLPYNPVSVQASPSRVTTRHEMIRMDARGMSACLVDAQQIVRAAAPGLKPRRYVEVRMKPAPSIELTRDIVLDPASCRLEDRISGDLDGMSLLFSVRYLPGASVRVDGLTKLSSKTGWGSDGRQTIDLYSARPTGSEIRYRCEIVQES
jgi:hypothetical protein